MSGRTWAVSPNEDRWTIPMAGATTFTWQYDDAQEKLLNLYEKAKRLQWNASDRIDWSIPVDIENPMEIPDEVVPIYGSRTWERLGPKQRAEVRLHTSAWQFSQFLHGEQGALICTARIVENVPNIDSKLYASTQVIDEGRHVEAFGRFLKEKIELTYPINVHLKSLLDAALRDDRWDITQLSMQILVEGLALGAFGLIRNITGNPLARLLVALVMQDEARHVAFGRLALREYYPQLTDKERAEREAFVIDACYLMRDRFLAEEVWQTLGLDVDDCLEHVRTSEAQLTFRSLLFTRIVPTLKDIGLFGPRVREAFTDMGVLGYADVDIDVLAAEDERIAEGMDRSGQDHIEHTLAETAAAP